MILAYHILILGVLVMMAVIAAVNVFVIRSLRRTDTPVSTPLVSVLIPARNEAANIGICLSTLAEQDYHRYEVIVLDDGSADGTRAVAEQWSRTLPHVRVVQGTPLPDGWAGKAHACHQLSRLARGELLMFVDADTVHDRHSISAGVAAMQSSGAGLLTVIPHQRMKSFWERVLLPLLHFSTFSYLPLPLVWGSKNPRLAMANGQVMLFSRSTYESIGGHEAVHTALVEDVWLSRRVKAHGSRLVIMDGGDVVSCRMYNSFRGIWEGFSKNLFAGFRYSLAAMTAVIVFNILSSVVPFFLLMVFALTADLHAPSVTLVQAQVGVIILIRLLLAGRFKMDLASILLHPLAVLVFAAIAVNSCVWVLVGGGARWKGRRYNFRNQAIAHKL